MTVAAMLMGSGLVLAAVLVLVADQQAPEGPRLSD
jgi:hypothetical protein